MITIEDKFHKDNICILRNIQSYYSTNFELISETFNGDYVDVVVKVRSKKEWLQKRKDANR